MRSLFGLARQSESAEVLDLLSKLTEKIDDSIEPMKPQHMCQALYGLASLGGTWQVPTANASAMMHFSRLESVRCSGRTSNFWYIDMKSRSSAVLSFFMPISSTRATPCHVSSSNQRSRPDRMQQERLVSSQELS